MATRQGLPSATDFAPERYRTESQTEEVVSCTTSECHFKQELHNAIGFTIRDNRCRRRGTLGLAAGRPEVSRQNTGGTNTCRAELSEIDVIEGVEGFGTEGDLHTLRCLE